MAPPRTHLDVGETDLVESGDRFFFAPTGLDLQEINLVRTRVNLDGEGHTSRDAALAHLDMLREFEFSMRGRLGTASH